MSRWEQHLGALAAGAIARWYSWAFAVTGNPVVAMVTVDDAVVASLTRPTWALGTAERRARTRVLRALERVNAEPVEDLSEAHRQFLALPGRARLAMVLHVHEGMTPVRIAAELGRQPREVVRDLSRAAQVLGDSSLDWGLDPALFTAVDGVSVTLVTRAETP